MNTEDSKQKDNPIKKDHLIDEALLEELLKQSVLLNTVELETFDEEETAFVDEAEAEADEVRVPELEPDPLFAMEMPMEKREQPTEISRAKKELDEYMEKISLMNKEKAFHEKENPKKKAPRPTVNDEKQSSENTLKMMPKKAPKEKTKQTTKETTKKTTKKTTRLSPKIPRKTPPWMTSKSSPHSGKNRFHQDLKISTLKVSALTIESDFCLKMGELRGKPGRNHWDLTVK